MKRLLTASAAVIALGLPAHAQGDAEKGEKEFRKCRACHMIASEDETFVKGGRSGPNLYGVIGRQAGSAEDFGYGESLVEAGEGGLVWDEENLAEYVADPKRFLSDHLGTSAVSKMTFKLRKGGEDVAAYLATFSITDEGVEVEVDEEADS